ncbi:hypothetical protein BDA99DRAFT_329986 [Phascolomyces articulosus]|uniref:PH domain-containing protein n=1 Tax=Phascolomyces articulosus TaxID=60185 RepID=A0AAD5KHJ2_9FUNG|nr:hypothetical protein BDA99DRAFT_329986 [Phascolomyces articulosus]
MLPPAQGHDSTSLLPLPPPPTGSTPTKRRSKVPNADRRNTDIEFATEIGQGLLVEVRKMQAIVQEKEDQLKALQAQKADLERAAESMAKQLRQKEENEEKLKEETWNLELAKQELTISVTELQQNLSKANAEQKRMQEHMDELTTEIEHMRDREEKLSASLEAMKQRHEQDMATIRRHSAGLQREKTDHIKQIEALSSELAIAKAQSKIAKRSHSDLRPAAAAEQSEKEKSEHATTPTKEGTTPGSSPPSSPKQTPTRNQQLEVETLKTSLAHAHRMVSNLRSNLHKEKTEKFELKKLLTDSQEKIEELQNDPRLWVDAGYSKSGNGGPGANNGGPDSGGSTGKSRLRKGKRRVPVSKTRVARIPKGGNESLDDSSDVEERRKRKDSQQLYYSSQGESEEDEDDDDEYYEVADETPNSTTASGFTSLDSELSKSQQPKKQHTPTVSVEPPPAETENKNVPRSLGDELSAAFAGPDTTSSNTKAGIVGGVAAAAAAAAANSNSRATGSDAGVQTDDIPVPPKLVYHEVSVQTARLNDFQEFSTSIVDIAPTTVHDQEVQCDPPPKTTDAETQCIQLEYVEQGVQSEPAKSVDASAQCEPPATHDQGVQSDAVEGIDQSTQSIVAESVHAGVQSEIVPSTDASCQSDPIPVKETNDVSVQSENVETVDVSVQSEPPVPKETSDVSVQSDPPVPKETNDMSVQSDAPVTIDSGVQSKPPVTTDSGVQSEPPVTKESGVQSEPPVTKESGVQSEPPVTKDNAVQSELPITKDSSVQYEYETEPGKDAVVQTDFDSSNVGAGAGTTAAAVAAGGALGGLGALAAKAFGKWGSDADAQDESAAAENVKPADSSRDETSSTKLEDVPKSSSSSSSSPAETTTTRGIKSNDQVTAKDTPSNSNEFDNVTKDTDDDVEKKTEKSVVDPGVLAVGAVGAIAIDGKTNNYKNVRPSSLADSATDLPKHDDDDDDENNKMFTKAETDAMIAAAVAAAMAKSNQSSKLNDSTDDQHPLATDSSIKQDVNNLTSTAAVAAATAGPETLINNNSNIIPTKRSLADIAGRDSMSQNDRHETRDMPVRPTSPPPAHLLSRVGQASTISSNHRSSIGSISTTDKGKTPIRSQMLRNVQQHRPSSTLSSVSPSEQRVSIASSPYANSLRTEGDPAHIGLITQTMIGDWLWKYTRKSVGDQLSDHRHKRYFWIHPYTRTLYWSNRAPGTHGDESKAKSAHIESVTAVPDHNHPPSPDVPNMSLLIQTTNRVIKLTAPNLDRHNVWYEALSYLVTRPGAGGNNNDQRSQHAKETTSSHGGSRSIIRKPSIQRVQNLFRSGSKTETSPTTESALSGHQHDHHDRSVDDDDEDMDTDDEALEDVRMCCDGKHHVSKLERDHVDHRPYYRKIRMRSPQATPTSTTSGPHQHHHHSNHHHHQPTPQQVS